jgi:hypothetical protein
MGYVREDGVVKFSETSRLALVSNGFYFALLEWYGDLESAQECFQPRNNTGLTPTYIFDLKK